MELKKEENEESESWYKSIWNKVVIFSNKNKNELIVVLCLLVVYNFICSTSMSYQYLNKQSGGEGEEIAQQMGKSLKGQDGKEAAKALAKNTKGFGLMRQMLGWLLSFVKSLLTFAGLVLVLAVLPGLPIFIFMLILFFILRARVAVIKAY